MSSVILPHSKVELQRIHPAPSTTEVRLASDKAHAQAVQRSAPAVRPTSPHLGKNLDIVV